MCGCCNTCSCPSAHKDLSCFETTYEWSMYSCGNKIFFLRKLSHDEIISLFRPIIIFSKAFLIIIWGLWRQLARVQRRPPVSVKFVADTDLAHVSCVKKPTEHINQGAHKYLLQRFVCVAPEFRFSFSCVRHFYERVGPSPNCTYKIRGSYCWCVKV